MRTLLTILYKVIKKGSYVGKNAYGSEYRIQKSDIFEEMLSFSNVKDNTYRFNRDPYLDWHIPIKINIAKKLKLNGQLLYKINKKISPLVNTTHLIPEIDYLYDEIINETIIYIKLEAIVIYDQNKNMIYYKKIDST